MSSITGSCESPTSVLFQKGIERSEEKQMLEIKRVEKASILNIQASSAENTSNTASSDQHQSSPQKQRQVHGALGRLVDVFA